MDYSLAKNELCVVAKDISKFTALFSFAYILAHNKPHRSPDDWLPPYIPRTFPTFDWKRMCWGEKKTHEI